jgi:hypothetical protein
METYRMDSYQNADEIDWWLPLPAPIGEITYEPPPFMPMQAQELRNIDSGQIAGHSDAWWSPLTGVALVSLSAVQTLSSTSDGRRKRGERLRVTVH